MFCSTLGAGAPVLGPPSDSGGGLDCQVYRAHACASAVGRYGAAASAVLE
jgi:hypothetical protein